MPPVQAEPSPQAEAIAFLAEPATHGGNPVSRIDTHAAIVFLAGDKAYKLKREVRFPFLDYSTIDKRKVMCEREVERNRRFAPDIYLGVLAITRESNGALDFRGKGQPVDWVVEMRRFDDAARLDLVVEKHGIDDALADALAETMAKAHARSQARDASVWIADLAQYIEQNDKAFRAEERYFPYHRARELTLCARQNHTRIADLLNARGRQGKVRLGHGDAHLGNIALIEGRPVLFDAIEFDDTIATGDVLYDLAFLLMDLWEGASGRAQIAFSIAILNFPPTPPIQSIFRQNEAVLTTRICLNILNLAAFSYQESDAAFVISALDALAALPFFLMMRAAIRAKVIAAAIPRQPPPERDKAAAAVARYFEWAENFLEPALPRIVAIGGLSGTGKSTQARLAAPSLGIAPGAVILRTDTIRKRLYGIAETERAPSAAYDPQAHDRVYAALLDAADHALAAGHSVIVDAVFAKPEEREAVEDVARRVETRFDGIWLDAPLETKIARVERREHDVSDADTQVVALQQTYDLGRLSWKRIDAASPIDVVAAEVRDALEP